MSDKKKRLAKVSTHREVEHLAPSQNLNAITCGGIDFRGFIENLPVMFYAVDPHPPFAPLYVSPAFESFGYPLDDWIKNPDMWLRVVHPEDCKRILEHTE